MGEAEPVIRVAGPDDAAALLELKLALDRETSFMLIEPGERRETVSDLSDHLAGLRDRPGSTLLVAELNGRLVGYLEAVGGDYARNRQCAYLVLGVRRAASGRGIGARLLREVVAWAGRYGPHRLELTVRADNARAIALYERCGFEVEGRRRDALLVGGSYVDELWMARLQSSE